MPLTDEQLVAELHRVAEELGRPPSLKQFRARGRHSVTTYFDRFGSWRDALAAAGFEPREPVSEIPDERLLRELRRLADRIGDAPTALQMDERGPYWASTYVNHFGSWNAALEAADFEPRTPRAPTPVLLEDLRRVADELEKTPTIAEYDDHGTYSASTYRHRFGTWREAVEAAGLEPPPKPVRTEAELLEELHRLAKDLGKRPTASTMADEGAYAVATYQRRFGSWSAALEAAFEDDS